MTHAGSCGTGAVAALRGNPWGIPWVRMSASAPRSQNLSCELQTQPSNCLLDVFTWLYKFKMSKMLPLISLWKHVSLTDLPYLSQQHPVLKSGMEKVSLIPPLSSLCAAIPSMSPCWLYLQNLSPTCSLPVLKVHVVAGHYHLLPRLWR